MKLDAENRRERRQAFPRHALRAKNFGPVQWVLPARYACEGVLKVRQLKEGRLKYTLEYYLNLFTIFPANIPKDVLRKNISSAN